MIDALSSTIPQAPDQPQPRNAPEAAEQFEALLLAQMLRAAHAEQDQEDHTADTMWDLAAQQFSQVMAKNGGVGLARLITHSLTAPAEPD